MQSGRGDGSIAPPFLYDARPVSPEPRPPCGRQTDGRWDVVIRLGHFALINYALPRLRLERHIPVDRFEIPEFEMGGQRLAMMSAVPFLDLDFHKVYLPPTRI